MEMKWYLVYTKSGFEKKVSDFLTKKKIESYCPGRSSSRNWNENKKIEGTVLFRGYVFIKTHISQLPEIKKISGVVNLIYWMGKPVCVKNVEIKAMRLFLHEYSNVTIEKTAVRQDSVAAYETDIESEAPMIAIKNKKAFINLPSIGYILSAEIETANVRIISSEDVLHHNSLKTRKLFNKVSDFNNSLKNYWAKALIIAISISLVVS